MIPDFIDFIGIYDKFKMVAKIAAKMGFMLKMICI